MSQTANRGIGRPWAFGVHNAVVRTLISKMPLPTLHRDHHGEVEGETEDGVRHHLQPPPLHDYEIVDRLECGSYFRTEVRASGAGLPPGGRLRQIETAKSGSSAKSEYEMGNRLNHCRNGRANFAHRREIARFAGNATQHGFTLVPLKVYFKDGRAKVELSVAHGKQMHDKREAKKKQEAQREIRRAMVHRNR